MAGALQTLEDTEPSLGQVKFDEWFETPVFESDSDERLEELATSRRGPLRLAANTFLRLNARADQIRGRTGPAGGRRRDPLPEQNGAAGGASPETLRRRFNAALDRWAEREAAGQARLERLILPKRWQA